MCRELQFVPKWQPRRRIVKPKFSIVCASAYSWCRSCTSQGARSWRRIFRGKQVTTLFSTPEVQPKTKHTLLPILTVLFLISYGLMTLLIVEQGSTIQSQRTLIQQLLGDSTELSAMKSKAIQQHQQALSPKPQAEAEKRPPVQAPSTQAAPSEKASTARNQGKAHRPTPEKPPVPASDIADVRRSLMSI